jgi:hypothetical protein
MVNKRKFYKILNNSSNQMCLFSQFEFKDNEIFILSREQEEKGIKKNERENFEKRKKE